MLLSRSICELRVFIIRVINIYADIDGSTRCTRVPTSTWGHLGAELALSQHWPFTNFKSSIAEEDFEPSYQQIFDFNAQRKTQQFQVFLSGSTSLRRTKTSFICICNRVRYRSLCIGIFVVCFKLLCFAGLPIMPLRLTVLVAYWPFFCKQHIL